MILPFRGDYKLTQGYGVNPDLYKRFGLLGHNGLDHAVPCGTELYAMITGKVIESTFDAGGYGNYIKIENGKEGALVAHLSKLVVKAGDSVKEGETYIGNSGTTGNSTGCHTHTGYYQLPRNRSNGYAGYIDPIPFLTDKPAEILVPVETFEQLVTKATAYDALLIEHEATEALLKENERVNAEKTIQIVGLVEDLDELTSELDDYKSNLKICNIKNTQLEIKLKACENPTIPPEMPPTPPTGPQNGILDRLSKFLEKLGF